MQNFSDNTPMDKLCRTCLRMPDVLVPLFENEKLRFKIKAISDIELSFDATLPKSICQECVKNAHLAFNFRNLIIKNDANLTQRLMNLTGVVEDFKSVCRTPEEDDVPEDDFMVSTDTELEECMKFLTEKVKSKREVESLKHGEKVEFLIPKVKMENDPGNLNREDNIKVPTQRVKRENDNAGNLRRGEKVVRRRKKIAPGRSLTIKPKSTMMINKRVGRKCTLCDYETTCVIKLRAHKRCHLPRGICNICGKSCTIDNLKKHISNHTANPAPCDECTSVLKNPEALRVHKILHRRMRVEQIVCDICGKRYKYRHSLADHKKTHFLPEEEKIKCAHCDKRFYRNHCLKKHMQVHTGERPAPCPYCDKRLSGPYALKTHIRIHTGEKPYLCQFCPMAFKQKVSLTTHMKSKHNDRVKKETTASNDN